MRASAGPMSGRWRRSRAREMVKNARKPGSVKGKGGSPHSAKWTGAQVRAGMMTRVYQRCSLAATLRLPAVPALADYYEALCAGVFASMHREYEAEAPRVRAMLEEELRRAHA